MRPKEKRIKDRLAMLKAILLRVMEFLSWDWMEMAIDTPMIHMNQGKTKSATVIPFHFALQKKIFFENNEKKHFFSMFLLRKKRVSASTIIDKDHDDNGQTTKCIQTFNSSFPLGSLMFSFSFFSSFFIITEQSRPLMNWSGYQVRSDLVLVQTFPGNPGDLQRSQNEKRPQDGKIRVGRILDDFKTTILVMNVQVVDSILAKCVMTMVTDQVIIFVISWQFPPCSISSVDLDEGTILELGANGP